jgi:hypothetical protein
VLTVWPAEAAPLAITVLRNWLLLLALIGLLLIVVSCLVMGLTGGRAP